MNPIYEPIVTQVGVVPASARGSSECGRIEREDYQSRDRQIFPRQPRPRREAVRTVTIDMDNLRALFRARHFLAGVLIGAAILLAVLLVM